MLLLLYQIECKTIYFFTSIFVLNSAMFHGYIQRDPVRFESLDAISVKRAGRHGLDLIWWFLLSLERYVFSCRLHCMRIFLGAREITLFDSARYALAAIFCFIIDEDFLLAEIRIWHQKEGSWNQNYLAVANWWLMVNFDLVKDFCWKRTLLCSRQTLVYTSSNSTEKINDSRKKCVPVFIWRKGGVFFEQFDNISLNLADYWSGMFDHSTH